MPARNLIEFAVIQERFDGVDVGPKIAPCRIVLNGESPNTQVKAYVWCADDTEVIGHHADSRPIIRSREPGFVEVDRLTEAEVIDPGGKLITIRGTSDKLQTQNLLPKEQAHVEWQVELRGCQGCS